MRKEKAFHYIYKITRFDGAYYIGMHSTDDLDDGYFGSGKRLWFSIRYHGKDKHTKEILEFLSTRKDLVAREKDLITEETLRDKKCLNLCIGGGYTVRAPDHPDGAMNKSKAIKKFYASEAGQLARRKISEANTGRTHTLAAKANYKVAAKARMAKMQADGSWEEVKKKNANKHRGKIQSAETIAKKVAAGFAYKEANGGKRTFSEQARLNISKSLIGSARNAKTWNLISIEGTRIEVVNLKKWLREHNLKAGAKIMVRNQDGNITHYFER